MRRFANCSPNDAQAPNSFRHTRATSKMAAAVLLSVRRREPEGRASYDAAEARPARCFDAIGEVVVDALRKVNEFGANEAHNKLPVPAFTSYRRVAWMVYVGAPQRP